MESSRVGSGVSGRKKILLVVRWPVGGIRTFMRYVYQGLDPDEWAISLIAPDVPEVRVLLEADLGHLDIQFIPLAAKITARSFVWRVTRAIARGRFDLVHSHGFTSGIAGAVGARLFRNKHLVTSHDVITANQFRGKSGEISLGVIGRLLNLADMIHSVSQDAQDNMQQNFPAISGKKCIVISNGVEIRRFATAQARDFRTELGRSPDVFLIGFLGRFMRQKGFSDLVGAIEILNKRNSLPRKPLVLTFGDGGFIRRDRQLVQDLGLADSFFFLPFTPNVAESIMGLDVVAMPSRWEACGLVAMEALVCGTPLVASDCIGLREVVRGSPASVFPAGDSEALADALADHMVTDKRAAFATYRTIARDRFDVTSQSRAIVDLYRAMT